MSSTNIEKNLASEPAPAPAPAPAPEPAPDCTSQPLLSPCPPLSNPTFPNCTLNAGGSCLNTTSNNIIYDTSTTTTSTPQQCSNRNAGGSCLPAPFALWIRDTTYLYLAIQTWGQMLYGSPHLFKGSNDLYNGLYTNAGYVAPPQESWYQYTIGNWIGNFENDFVNGYIKTPTAFFQNKVLKTSQSLWNGVDYNGDCYLNGESQLSEPKCLQANCASLLKLPITQTCTEGSTNTTKFKLTLNLSQYMYDQLNTVTALDGKETLIAEYINFFLGIENKCSGPVCGENGSSPSLNIQYAKTEKAEIIGPGIDGGQGWTVKVKIPDDYKTSQTVNIMLLNKPDANGQIKQFDLNTPPTYIYSIVNHNLNDFLAGTPISQAVTDKGSTDLRDWFACTYPFTVEITQFTPMLVVYFIMNDKDNMFRNFLNSYPYDEINEKLNPNQSSDTASLENFLFLDPTAPIPMPLCCEFKNISDTLTSKQKDIIKKACQSIYTPPTKFQKTGIPISQFVEGSSSIDGSVSKFIANSFSGSHGQGICRCLQSSIVPSRVFEDQEFPYYQGLCFDKDCTNFRDLWYGPDKYKEICREYCPQVYDWLHDSSDPASRETQQEFMLQPFKSICGRNYNPDNLTFLGDPVRVSIVLSAVVLLTLTTLITNSWVSTFLKKTFLFLISSIIIGGVAAFCCIELQGTAVCPEIAGKIVDSICVGKITGKTIPQEYCKEVKGCECYFGNETLCPPCTSCDLGFCLTQENPKCKNKVTRNSQIVTKRHINTLGVGIGVTLSVCVPLITYIFMRRYYPSIPRKYLIIVSVILLGGILAATFVPSTSIETAQVREYDSLIPPGKVEPSPDEDIVAERGKEALTGFTAFLGIILILIGIFLIYTFITRKKPTQSNKRFEYGIITAGIIVILIITISLGVIFAKKPPPKMPTGPYGPSAPPPESTYVYVLKLKTPIALGSSSSGSQSWTINDFVHNLSQPGTSKYTISSIEDLEKAMPHGIGDLEETMSPETKNNFFTQSVQYIYCYPWEGQWKWYGNINYPKPVKIIWGPGDDTTCTDPCKADVCAIYKKGIPNYSTTTPSSCPSSVVDTRCGNVPIIDTNTDDKWQYVFITSDYHSWVNLVTSSLKSTSLFTLSNGKNSNPPYFTSDTPPGPQKTTPPNACPTPNPLFPFPPAP